MKGIDKNFSHSKYWKYLIEDWIQLELLTLLCIPKLNRLIPPLCLLVNKVIHASFKHSYIRGIRLKLAFNFQGKL